MLEVPTDAHVVLCLHGTESRKGGRWVHHNLIKPFVQEEALVPLLVASADEDPDLTTTKMVFHGDPLSAEQQAQLDAELGKWQDVVKAKPVTTTLVTHEVDMAQLRQLRSVPYQLAEA